MALELARKVFSEYELSDYAPEGMEEFRKCLHDEEYLTGMSIMSQPGFIIPPMNYYVILIDKYPVCRAHHLRVMGFSFLWKVKVLYDIMRNVCLCRSTSLSSHLVRISISLFEETTAEERDVHNTVIWHVLSGSAAMCSSAMESGFFMKVKRRFFG